MNCSVIVAHPTPSSFNHALARAAAAVLRQHGYEIHWHDLYAEQFVPLLETEEIPKEAPLHPSLRRQCEEIVQADGIVIVHPNWWSQPPAILKGWLDRVLRPGMAYTFATNDQGEGQAVGLLRAQAALVINTANTPQEKEVSLLGDPLDLIWRKCVFGLCGVENFHRLVFSPVIISSAAQRQQWLHEVEIVVDRIFRPEKR